MKFNPYYNKQITIDDLDYITTDNIKDLNINITSDKMYAEAHDYNDHMFEMQKKREIYVRDMWKVIIFNLLSFILLTYFTLTFGSLDFLNTDILSLFYKLSNNTMFCTIALIFVFLLFSFVVFLRKVYDLKIATGILLFTLPINFSCIILIFFNFLLLKPLKKHHDAIKDDIGYPYFLPLHLTFYNEEVMEKVKKSVHEYKFDDYKINPDTEMGIPEL